MLARERQRAIECEREHKHRVHVCESMNACDKLIVVVVVVSAGLHYTVQCTLYARCESGYIPWMCARAYVYV